MGGREGKVRGGGEGENVFYLAFDFSDLPLLFFTKQRRTQTCFKKKGGCGGGEGGKGEKGKKNGILLNHLISATTAFFFFYKTTSSVKQLLKRAKGNFFILFYLSLLDLGTAVASKGILKKKKKDKLYRGMY